MVTSERIESVTGIGVLLYRSTNPDQILIAREAQYKRLTGKLVGEWATTGYETQESKPSGVLETYREVIDRYSTEEIRKIRGQIYIPDNLEEARLCSARISEPEMAAWVHAYHFPVSDDFEAEIGDFKGEISEIVWSSCRKLLVLRGTALEILLRPAAYEILQEHIWALEGRPRSGDYFNPVNLPPWEFYDIMEQGAPSQDAALCQLGIDPWPLANSAVLIRSL